MHSTSIGTRFARLRHLYTGETTCSLSPASHFAVARLTNAQRVQLAELLLGASSDVRVPDLSMPAVDPIIRSILLTDTVVPRQRQVEPRS